MITFLLSLPGLPRRQPAERDALTAYFRDFLLSETGKYTKEEVERAAALLVAMTD